MNWLGMLLGSLFFLGVIVVLGVIPSIAMVAAFLYLPTPWDWGIAVLVAALDVWGAREFLKAGSIQSK